MGSITFGYRNGCTEKNGYVGYSKWIIKMQYHDLCLDQRYRNCVSVNTMRYWVKNGVSMMGFGLG